MLEDGAALVRNLVGKGLLQHEAQRGEIALHPDLRQSLHLMLTPAQRAYWHGWAATFYEGQQAFLEAAYQQREAGAYENAAQLVSTHYQEIVDALQLEALGEFVREFRPNHIPQSLWLQSPIPTTRQRQIPHRPQRPQRSRRTR